MRGRRKENSEIAYTMPKIGWVALEVKSSANAWWMDQTRLQLLYSAFGVEATIREACAYAHITVKQYKYFRSLHPEIDDVRAGFETWNMLRARKTVLSAIEGGNYKMAMKYLEMARPEEFGKPSRRKPKTTFTTVPNGIPLGPIPEKNQIGLQACRAHGEQE